MKKLFACLLSFLRALPSYLADTLSLLRLAGVGYVIAFSHHDAWKVAAVLLGLAWSTDLLDGYAARRFGSLKARWPKFDADGIADFALEMGSSLALVLYFWRFEYGWIALCAWLCSLLSGCLMAAVMERGTSMTRNIIKFNMMVFHGGVNIAATMVIFAYLACRPYGWWGAVTTTLILVGAGYTQRHKVRLWMAGELR